MHVQGGKLTVLLTADTVALSYFVLDFSSLFSQVQLSRGEQYAQQVNALFCETSALKATNVEELFIQISEYISNPVVRVCTTPDYIVQRNLH